MKCLKCRHENRAGAKFCEECAAPLARVCPNCGSQVSVTARFCPECAHPIGSAAQAAAATRFTSPESYTPRHLAEKILTSRAALEGERKLITVLFADLKGSLELLADRDPEEARKLLDPVLEHMMEAVHRYEGTVNQVMGDGIMALFGAPLAHEDHAVRACYAALRMQESVQRYAPGVLHAHGVPLRIRVGLNSGEVVVRAIGSDLRMDYSAIGQTTHLGARMEQLAEPGTSLLTRATFDLAEGYVEAKSRGQVPVKGLTQPVEVFELIGIGAIRSRLQAAAVRGLTRLTGRESEMNELRLALESTALGHGEVVSVVGEPGVGKSRLCWEFIHSSQTHGWLILESRSVSYGQANPYLPIIDLLKAYFQIEGRDHTGTMREKVASRISSLDPQLESSLPALLSLLDIPVADPAWQQLAPAQRRQQTLDGVKRLLLRESRVQPLVVMVEDLHWIDSETQALLDSLAESLSTSRLLLLVNYRPEYQHNWGNKKYHRRVRIDSLEPASAEDLLATLIGTDKNLDPLKRVLIERTQGNPLFLEESVRSLVETKVITEKRGEYRLGQEGRTIQIPATVQGILAARIDRLSPEQKRLLQAASVIGKDVPFPLLLGIAELPEEDLRRRLTHLQDAELLYERSLHPDLEYTFKHPLTHEVAYGSVLHDRRRALHGRIVQAIEAHYVDRLGEQVERLGHHAFRGAVWDKAVTYLRQAGAKAQARSANREAVADFEQARDALRHLPQDRATTEQAIDLLCIDFRNALVPLGEYQVMLNYVREAEALATALGDKQRLGRIFLALTEYYRLMGDPEQAAEAGRRALALSVELEDLTLQVQCNLNLGAVYQRQGDYRAAKDALMSNVRTLTGELKYKDFGHMNPPSVSTRTWLIWSLAELGEFAAGKLRAQEQIEIATAVGFHFGLVHANFALGVLSLWQGDLPNAIIALERGLGYCRAGSIAIFFPLTAASLGYAYALSGRLAEGASLLEESAERLTSLGVVMNRSLILAMLGEVYLFAGRTEEAFRLGESAVSLARENKERGHHAWAVRLLGELAAHRDPLDAAAADAHYHQATALATELGMRPLIAHCSLGLGKLHRRTGMRERAREHLADATTMYREMDMRFWLNQAEAEMGQLQSS